MFMGRNVIDADAQDSGFCIVKTFQVVAKGAGFFCTAGRVDLGVEIEDEVPGAHVVGGADIIATAGLCFKLGRLCHRL